MQLPRRPGPGYPSGCTAPNQKSAMDDKERQIDEMGEAREAQYALECVLVRLTEVELQRVIDDLPPRAREHIRATTAHKMRHLGEQHPDWPGRGSTESRPL